MVLGPKGVALRAHKSRGVEDVQWEGAAQGLAGLVARPEGGTRSELLGEG